MLHSDYSLLTGLQEVPELPTRDQFEQVAWVCLSEGGGRGWASLWGVFVYRDKHWDPFSGAVLGWLPQPYSLNYFSNLDGLPW